MKQTYIVYAILVFAIIMSFTFPHITQIAYNNRIKAATYETKNQKQLAKVIKTSESTEEVANKASNVELAIAPSIVKEEPKEEPKEEKTEEVQEAKTIPAEETQPATTAPTKLYGEMTTEELIEAINNGTYKLEYSKVYDTNTNGLTKSKGAIYYNNHKETYYSQRVLKGTSLNIPGRHVADDGTVRDQDGYISLAASTSYLARGSIVKTSLGPGKVYDSGCASGIIDIYTNW